MASSLTAIAARRAATNLTRLSSSSSSSSSNATSLIQRRNFSADHHGPARINIWEDPMSPSKWKEEQFVIVSLSGWGLLFYGAYKFFTGGKKDEKKLAEAS